MPIHSLPQKTKTVRIKSSFLALIFSLFLVSGVLAQEKYEYAIVKQFGREVLFISSDTIDREVVNGGGDNQIFQATLIKLNQLSEKWEVYNTSEVNIGSYKGYTYFLRRKKN